MKLTLILACLWLDYYFDTGARWRNQAWFDSYVHWVKSLLGNKQSLWQGPLSLAIVLVPVAIILAIVWSIAGRFSGVIELIIGFGVLWFCFGPTHLQEAIVHYLKKDGDHVEAEKTLKVEASNLISTQPFHRGVTELIFWQAHERFFGVIFWFLLLGPVGAILFRMSSWMQQTAPRLQADFYPQYAQHVNQLYWIIAWAPSRLAAFSYALVGNFLPGFEKWKDEAFKADHCRETLIDSGVAALGAGAANEANREENLKAQGIVQRSLIVWVIVIAVGTLSRVFI